MPSQGTRAPSKSNMLRRSLLRRFATIGRSHLAVFLRSRASFPGPGCARRPYCILRIASPYLLVTCWRQRVSVLAWCDQLTVTVADGRTQFRPLARSSRRLPADPACSVPVSSGLGVPMIAVSTLTVADRETPAAFGGCVMVYLPECKLGCRVLYATSPGLAYSRSAMPCRIGCCAKPSIAHKLGTPLA